MVRDWEQKSKPQKDTSGFPENPKYPTFCGAYCKVTSRPADIRRCAQVEKLLALMMTSEAKLKKEKVASLTATDLVFALEGVDEDRLCVRRFFRLGFAQARWGRWPARQTCQALTPTHAEAEEIYTGRIVELEREPFCRPAKPWFAPLDAGAEGMVMELEQDAVAKLFKNCESVVALVLDVEPMDLTDRLDRFRITGVAKRYTLAPARDAALVPVDGGQPAPLADGASDASSDIGEGLQPPDALGAFRGGAPPPPPPPPQGLRRRGEASSGEAPIPLADSDLAPEASYDWLVSELEQIMGDAATELLAGEEAAETLEEAGQAAAHAEEAKAAKGKRNVEEHAAAEGASGASGSGGGSVRDEATFQEFVTSLGLVDVSTATKFQFADASSPTRVVLQIPVITWATGKVSVKALCRRSDHGPSGTCAIWFNKSDDSHARRLRVVQDCLRWSVEGRHMDEQAHWAAGQRLKQQYM